MCRVFGCACVRVVWFVCCACIYVHVCICAVFVYALRLYMHCVCGMRVFRTSLRKTPSFARWPRTLKSRHLKCHLNINITSHTYTLCDCVLVTQARIVSRESEFLFACLGTHSTAISLSRSCAPPPQMLLCSSHVLCVRLLCPGAVSRVLVFDVSCHVAPGLYINQGWPFLVFLHLKCLRAFS